MDTDALVAHARARFDHSAARRVMREKYEARLLFGHQGGMFRASPEMITFLHIYGDENIVIKDLYDTPIAVQAKELCDIARSRWQEQMNAWLVEYQELNKKR